MKNGELKRMGNETAISYFKMLFWASTGGTEEKHENS
jgi:hypothetical protein